jgi:hypothetical protein
MRFELTVGGRIPARGSNFSLLNNVRDRSGVHSTYFLKRAGSLCPGIKRLEREADKSQSSVEIKNGRAMFLLSNIYSCRDA